MYNSYTACMSHMHIVYVHTYMRTSQTPLNIACIVLYIGIACMYLVCKFSLSLFSLFSFVVASCLQLLLFAQELVLEKESRLRESMKMMGLKSSALFSAWFVKQLIFMMLTGLAVTVLIKVSTYVLCFSVLLL